MHDRTMNTTDGPTDPARAQARAAAGAASDPAPEPTDPAPRDESWDEAVGLWFAGDGSAWPAGFRPHVIRESARKLVDAGLGGTLSDVQVERVLANLRAAQQKDGELRGNFWWEWSAGRVTDRNSGFFTTMHLLALHYEFRDALSETARRRLDELLCEARHWFAHKVWPITEDKLRYPNAYLGDATCLWLLSEQEGRIDDALRRDFVRILSYYRDREWGWGEHLSDIYAKICQNELVSLLLWAKELPSEARRLVVELLKKLVALDGLFDGGPRVPALRSYCLDKSPGRAGKLGGHYRAYFTPPGATFKGGHPPAWFAHRVGLDRRFALPARTSPAVTVACYDGAQAVAWIEARWRIGVMSRFPLFPDMDTHPNHGLHWQSMPVAFWHVAGDWGYLQWATEEDGAPRALPAFARDDHRSRRLSDADSRAAASETRGMRHGREFVVLRRLPAVSARWPWASDRFRLVGATAAAPVIDTVDGWHRLVLAYPAETLTVAYHPLEGRPAVNLESGGENELRWGATWDLLADRPSCLAGLWYLTVGNGPQRPPIVQADGTTIMLAMADGVTLTLAPSEPAPWRETREAVAGSGRRLPEEGGRK